MRRLPRTPGGLSDATGTTVLREADRSCSTARYPARGFATSERTVQPGGGTPGGHANPRGGGVRLPYLPGIDGLRALAVIAVLLYHSGLPWIPGGFLGVEVFFVISGYLITALLLAEWTSRRSGSLGREDCCRRCICSSWSPSLTPSYSCPGRWRACARTCSRP